MSGNSQARERVEEELLDHAGDLTVGYCHAVPKHLLRDAAAEITRLRELLRAQPAAGEGTILLEMAEASREQELWERRFYQFCKSYPSWRTADDEGSWGLRDLLTYIAPICGFDASKVREP